MISEPHQRIRPKTSVFQEPTQLTLKFPAQWMRVQLLGSKALYQLADQMVIYAPVRLRQADSVNKWSESPVDIEWHMSKSIYVICLHDWCVVSFVIPPYCNWQFLEQFFNSSFIHLSAPQQLARAKCLQNGWIHCWIRDHLKCNWIIFELRECLSWGIDAQSIVSRGVR